MISFRVRNRLVAIQAATYMVPFYQRVESGSHASLYPNGEDAKELATSTGSNEAIVTHRLLIPIFKLSVVKADPDITPAMFEDKT